MDAIDASLADASVVRREGYAYVVHPLMDGVPRCQPALLEAWVAWARSQPEVREATVLLAPEAMALPMVAALSVATGIPYLLARKRSYGLPGETAARARTGYGSSTLYLNGLTPDDRVAIVDDVLSTGGTLGALAGALRSLGVPCVAAFVFIEKGKGAQDMEALLGFPVRSMRRIRVQGDRVLVEPR